MTDLDRQVALALGWKLTKSAFHKNIWFVTDGPKGRCGVAPPAFSKNIKEAMELRKHTKFGLRLSIGKVTALATFGGLAGEPKFQGFTETYSSIEEKDIAEAICVAFLRSKGIEP